MARALEEFEKHPLKYLSSNLGVALGIVLIWRGIWYLLDAFDLWAFGGAHWVSAIVGILIGILILYLPHHNLQALERL